MKGTARERLQSWRAQTAIVLGSGLNSLVEEVAFEQRISYGEFAELPPSKVAGHVGQFAVASVNDEPIIYAQGRAHLYEGHSAHAVTAGVRLLAECGIKRIVLTNAAGTANPAFHPGRWMILRDHLNLTGTSPLVGSGQFVDMSAVYAPEIRACFMRVANEAKITLHEGVYAGLLGPQYETPSEVRMLRTLGADAIGMSTVLEAIQARALGLEVIGFSCLTNWAAGIGEDELSHHEVLAVGKNAAAEFSRLLSAAL
ncbi:MAG: purine-nucleoside phosphorylase [Verrucomicrobiota bacterium]|nr:purine-nucleoside phosphorylase [Verrucomicrobiota bacterium]